MPTFYLSFHKEKFEKCFYSNRKRNFFKNILEYSYFTTFPEVLIIITRKLEWLEAITDAIKHLNGKVLSNLNTKCIALTYT